MNAKQVLAEALDRHTFPTTLDIVEAIDHLVRARIIQLEAARDARLAKRRTTGKVYVPPTDPAAIKADLDRIWESCDRGEGIPE